MLRPAEHAARDKLDRVEMAENNLFMNTLKTAVATIAAAFLAASLIAPAHAEEPKASESTPHMT